MKIKVLNSIAAIVIFLCTISGGASAQDDAEIADFNKAKQIIAEVLEAGGTVTNTEGKAYTFDDKGVVASNGCIHKSLLQHMSVITTD